MSESIAGNYFCLECGSRYPYWCYSGCKAAKSTFETTRTDTASELLGDHIRRIVREELKRAQEGTT